MPIVGGLDIHRKQITFDYLDTATGRCGAARSARADREHLRAWLVRFAGRDDVAFAVEGCHRWRYVAEELAAAGIAVHLAEPADTAAARGRKRRAKTDKTDSRHLRRLLAEGRLPECWIRFAGAARLCDPGRPLAEPGSHQGTESRIRYAPDPPCGHRRMQAAIARRNWPAVGRGSYAS